MICCTLLLFAGGLAAQQAADAPDPKDKARQYLESAAGMIAAAPPESQASALLQLAAVEKAVDPKQAAEHLDQAFAAASVLPSWKENRLRQQTQAMIVRELAGLNLEKALEKLAGMETTPPDEIDPRAEAIEQIVTALTREKKIDEAASVMDRFSSTGAYSFGGAKALVAALAPDDDRRALIFGQVIAGFNRQPDLNAMESFVRGFGPWSTKPMPKTLFDSAVRSMAGAVLDNKGILMPDRKSVV